MKARLIIQEAWACNGCNGPIMPNKGVIVGESEYSESATAWLCRSCLLEAVAVMDNNSQPPAIGNEKRSNMPDFTPGPWRAVDVSEYRLRESDPNWEIDQEPGHETQLQWIATALREQDARLIAAGPDLYAAAKAVLYGRHIKESDWEALEAAIAKADGIAPPPSE